MKRVSAIGALCIFALGVVDGFNVVPSLLTSTPACLGRSVLSAQKSFQTSQRRPMHLKPVLGQRSSQVALGLRMAEYTVEKTADLDGGVARYKFTVQVPSDLTKTSYATIMKDFKKNAKFPGFRVGTIPSFMLPKVRSFVILECLERSLKEAVDKEALELADPEKKPFLDDAQVETLTKNFKETEGFSYTIEGEFKSTSVAAPAS